MWTLRRVPDKGGDVDLALVQTRRETNEKEKEDFAETVVTSVIQEQAVVFFQEDLRRPHLRARAVQGKLS